ncbi:MAG: biopolymer transporter ExbD [Pseudomonadales bacterium]|nr:biopolymer transporter ExbD [Pseudomonadales bacterium]
MSSIGLTKRRKCQNANKKTATLNLVSLMDIFTILVFFLMVNSSDVEVLESSSEIKLPDSNSEHLPANQLVISVDDQNVIVMGRSVAEVATLRSEKIRIIGGLEKELVHQANRKAEMPEGGYNVTIMGDREIPYWLLKKIMLTCQSANFAHISLAVNKLEESDDNADQDATS